MLNPEISKFLELTQSKSYLYYFIFHRSYWISLYRCPCTLEYSTVSDSTQSMPIIVERQWVVSLTVSVGDVCTHRRRTSSSFSVW